MTESEVFALLARPGVEQPLVAVIAMGAWAFFVGSTVGSFLNVVIARVPKGESVVRPRSRCPSCGTQIAWFDNVPIVSWIVLRGKCRACGVAISPRYAIVEALVGLIALGVFLRSGFSPRALELFSFAAILVAIAFIDLETWIIPHGLNAALVVVGLAFLVASLATGAPQGIAVVLGDGATGVDAAIARGGGAVIGFAILQSVRVLFTVYFRRTGRIGADEEAMGAGDPLLLGAMGLVLGYAALPLVIFLASFQGAVVGGIMALAGRLHPGGVPLEGDPEDWAPPANAFPFGPFLALGGLEVAFFGPSLIEAVLRWVFPF